MWQAPNQRVRAIATQKKRDRERNRRTFHVRRVKAELKVTGGLNAIPLIAEARLLLNDLSPLGLGLFSVSPMMVGQEIALTVEEPKRFYIKGRIVSCQEYDADSHVLTKKAYSYRIGIEFIFESQAEEERVRAYCEEIGKDYLYGAKVA